MISKTAPNKPQPPIPAHKPPQEGPGLSKGSRQSQAPKISAGVYSMHDFPSEDLGYFRLEMQLPSLSPSQPLNQTSFELKQGPQAPVDPVTPSASSAKMGSLAESNLDIWKNRLSDKKFENFYQLAFLTLWEQSRQAAPSKTAQQIQEIKFFCKEAEKDHAVAEVTVELTLQGDVKPYEIDLNLYGVNQIMDMMQAHKMMTEDKSKDPKEFEASYLEHESQLLIYLKQLSGPKS